MKYHYEGRAEGHTGSQVEQFSSGGYNSKFGYKEEEGMKLRQKNSSFSPTRDVEMKAPQGSHY
jgi:hypothetical protein